jgi:hypothetical protein
VLLSVLLRVNVVHLFVFCWLKIEKNKDGKTKPNQILSCWCAQSEGKEREREKGKGTPIGTECQSASKTRNVSPKFRRLGGFANPCFWLFFFPLVVVGTDIVGAGGKSQVGRRKVGGVRQQPSTPPTKQKLASRTGTTTNQPTKQPQQT